jgi:hypothetical protein
MQKLHTPAAQVHEDEILERKADGEVTFSKAQWYGVVPTMGGCSQQKMEFHITNDKRKPDNMMHHIQSFVARPNHEAGMASRVQQDHTRNQASESHKQSFEACWKKQKQDAFLLFHTQKKAVQ